MTTIDGALIAPLGNVFAGLLVVVSPAAQLSADYRSGLLNGIGIGIGIGETNTMHVVKQNVAEDIRVSLRSADTGLLLPGIAASITVSLCKKGQSTHGVITPIITSLGAGVYNLALTSTHLNTLGVTSLICTAPFALTREVFLDVVAVDRNDAVRAGLSALPNAGAAGIGGLPTIGSTIPNAVAGTSTGLALKQNVDDAVTSVNSHTDSTVSSMTSVVNAHTDAAIASGVPSTAAVRDSILNALLSDHGASGTVADGIALAAGLLQGNFMMDQTINGPNGQTAARLRIWRDASGAGAATNDGSGEGEFATFQVTTTYVGPGKVFTHQVVRVVGT